MDEKDVKKEEVVEEQNFKLNEEESKKMDSMEDTKLLEELQKEKKKNKMLLGIGAVALVGIVGISAAMFASRDHSNQPANASSQVVASSMETGNEAINSEVIVDDSQIVNVDPRDIRTATMTANGIPIEHLDGISTEQLETGFYNNYTIYLQDEKGNNLFEEPIAENGETLVVYGNVPETNRYVVALIKNSQEMQTLDYLTNTTIDLSQFENLKAMPFQELYSTPEYYLLDNAGHTEWDSSESAQAGVSTQDRKVILQVDINAFPMAVRNLLVNSQENIQNPEVLLANQITSDYESDSEVSDDYNIRHALETRSGIPLEHRTLGLAIYDNLPIRIMDEEGNIMSTLTDRGETLVILAKDPTDDSYVVALTDNSEELQTYDYLTKTTVDLSQYEEVKAYPFQEVLDAEEFADNGIHHYKLTTIFFHDEPGEDVILVDIEMSSFMSFAKNMLDPYNEGIDMNVSTVNDSYAKQYVK